MSRFDRQALRRFASLVKPFFVSEVKWKACGLLVLLATFSISVSSLNVLMSYVGRDFMTALSLKEKSEFIKQLIWYLMAFAGATPVVVFYRYTEERLGLLWRKWLTRTVLKKYFNSGSYYRLSWYGGIDNPDQRIEEDIRSFCASSLSFLLIIFNSCIALFAFMGILWSISYLLTVAVIVYAALGSVVTYFLGRPLIDLNFAQLKKEADFRYKLVNIRDNAESIAFYRGEKVEYTRTRQRFRIAIDNLLGIINWNRNLNFFTTGYNYLTGILPTIIVAPLYLDGRIEFGVVTQAGFAFGQVLGALSIIVLNFGSLSAFTAVITRLGTFWEVLSEIDDGRDIAGSLIQTVPGTPIAFQNVTILTPKRDQVLVRDLSFVLEGRALLITGPSGSGKSSILRAFAGLWSAGGGRIIRPDLLSATLLPQRPYMVLGTLRNQLLYATNHRAVLDSELLAVLERVGLSEMFRRVGSFDKIVDWQSILSTGEQQRLGFARLLFAQPQFACLDESTTAMEAQAEERMYKIVQENVQTYLSVGYRNALEKYHDTILELHGDGSWHVEKR